MELLQFQERPEAPDRIKQHSRNGPQTHEFCFEVVYVYVVLLLLIFLSFFLSRGLNTHPN